MATVNSSSPWSKKSIVKDGISHRDKTLQKKLLDSNIEKNEVEKPTQQAILKNIPMRKGAV